MAHLEWYCAGESVRGASHHRRQQPNQDAIAWFPDYPQIGRGAPLIVAVSDGHGSAKNFRSQVGAQKAVEVAIKVMHALFLDRSIGDSLNLSTIHDLAQTRLPQRLVKEWRTEIQQHWQEFNPRFDPVWQALIEQEGQPTQTAIEAMPQIAYGATLLTVLITDAFLLYVQLGDGDILCVDASGTPSRPIQRDSRLLANETTSLCTIDAWKEFQIRLVPLIDNGAIAAPNYLPALILLTTDGYANSFDSDDSFCEIGRDYLNLIRQEGLAPVVQQLSTFLEETTEAGSGDDITIALIQRMETGDRDLMIRQQDIDQNRLIEAEKKIDRLTQRHSTFTKQLKVLRLVTAVAIALALMTIPFAAFAGWRAKEADRSIAQLQTQLKTLEAQVVQLAPKPLEPAGSTVPPDAAGAQSQKIPKPKSAAPQ